MVPRSSGEDVQVVNSTHQEMIALSSHVPGGIAQANVDNDRRTASQNENEPHQKTENMNAVSRNTETNGSI